MVCVCEEEERDNKFLVRGRGRMEVRNDLNWGVCARRREEGEKG